VTHADSSLALSLARIHRWYLDGLTDDDQARTFARDWPHNTRSLAAALRRLGGSGWWQSREPYHEDDLTPFVIASIDPATGMVRFDAATADQVRLLPAADRFAWDGSPLEE
jgi:hypothetical protein